MLGPQNQGFFFTELEALALGSPRLFSSLTESQESLEESRESLAEFRPLSHDFGVPQKVHHVCELQFNLKKMIDVKESAAGHGSYERIRLFCGQTLLLVWGGGTKSPDRQS